MAQRDLRKVQRITRRLTQARAEFRDAVLAASESGESVRDIAPYAGVSSSRVHELLVIARNGAGGGMKGAAT